mgnify:CR=1 FL=1
MSAVNEFFVLVMAHFLGFCALYAVFEFCMVRFIEPLIDRKRKEAGDDLYD